MTSLNTHIPIEYIKQSKKLQEVMYLKDDEHIEKVYELGTAPTIADVIDNADKLFRKKKKKKNRTSHYSRGMSCGYTEILPGYRKICKMILTMCQDDKSIQEISEYIIKNIV